MIKIRKIAQDVSRGSPPAYWSKLKEGLMQVTNLSSALRGMLNNVDQIIFDTKAPDDKPNAVAYVSSGDKNSNGKIDKIHFVLPNLPSSTDDVNFAAFVEEVAHILVHEEAHIKDFNSDKDDFPGGESYAESVASAFKANLPPDLKVAYYRELLSNLSKDLGREKITKIIR